VRAGEELDGDVDITAGFPHRLSQLQLIGTVTRAETTDTKEIWVLRRRYGPGISS
jgi:hypothetical protein